MALSILEQLFRIDLPLQLPKLQPNDTLSFRQRKRQRTNIYQQKARKAIEQLSAVEKLSLPYSREFYCHLSENFALEEVKLDYTSDSFHVYSRVSAHTWQLVLSSRHSSVTEMLEIIIKPVRNRTWTLPVKKISLKTSILSPKAFSAIWKAFELELNRLGLKADLVQLCGYYQYPPNFQCKMSVKSNTFDEDSELCWDVVRKVVNGIGARKIYSTTELGQLWGVSSKLVSLYATQLKSVGFEVRNSNTNPQIPENCFLIPYSFPTLAPKSVQLYKKL